MTKTTKNPPDVPATEPAKPRVVAGEKLALRHKLSPRLKTHPYWLGALPGCPRSNVNLGGLSFQAITEKIARVEGATLGEVTRTPYPGAVMELTCDQVERFIEKLPRILYRFTGETHKDGRPAAGRVAVPTHEELEQVKASGVQYPKPYIPEEGDCPAAEFIYLVPAPERRRQSSSDLYPDWEGEPETWDDEHLPPPISVTGVWLPPEDDVEETE